jgi:hypothetical protein
LEEIPQVGKVSINQNIVHGYHHKQLKEEKDQEKLAVVLLFSEHFELDILFLLYLNLLLYFGDYHLKYFLLIMKKTYFFTEINF